MVLSFFVSGLVLVLGLLTAFVQSSNFGRAAELDEMQLESQWYFRRVSLLREKIERSEFRELEAQLESEHLALGEE